MKKKKFSEKDQLIVILKALRFVVFNWRSVIVVYGTIGALTGAAGTFILKKIFIPSARPVVRPIVRQYTDHYQLQIDSIKTYLHDH